MDRTGLDRSDFGSELDLIKNDKRAGGNTKENYAYYKSLYKDQPTGIPFAVENEGGNIWLCIKDGKGDIRRLEKHGSDANSIIELAKALGIKGGFRYGNDKYTTIE